MSPYLFQPIKRKETLRLPALLGAFPYVLKRPQSDFWLGAFVNAASLIWDETFANVLQSDLKLGGCSQMPTVWSGPAFGVLCKAVHDSFHFARKFWIVQGLNFYCNL